MALEPITRQEKIIAGQDLEPITRMEMFLKQFGGGGGGGGASSADMFIIHATTDETFTNAQLDKTAEQIYEAYQSGKYCLADLRDTFFPVTTVQNHGTEYTMECSGLVVRSNHRGNVVLVEFITNDGVTWAIRSTYPTLYDVHFERLQISGPGGHFYTLSVDANGNLTATPN